MLAAVNADARCAFVMGLAMVCLLDCPGAWGVGPFDLGVIDIFVCFNMRFLSLRGKSRASCFSLCFCKYIVDFCLAAGFDWVRRLIVLGCQK